jgi:5-methylcytosine-specific restriction endonuclease McrA
MNKSNKKKSDQLGLNYSTASHRLKKQIMLNLIELNGLSECYRCGKKIEKASDLSIDHKIDWIDSDDPCKLFWDLENIAFSHTNCNTLAGLDKKTDFRGVTKLEKRSKKFQARYWNGKKQIFVGYYDTAEQAKEAAEEAKAAKAINLHTLL